MMTRASGNDSEAEATTGFGEGAGASDGAGIGVTARSGGGTKQASRIAVSNNGLAFVAGIIGDQISLSVLR